MKRVAVLGSTGMLGHIVAQELENDNKLDVVRFCRRPTMNEQHFDALNPDSIRSVIAKSGVEYVINCAGLIKQLTVTNRSDWFVVNSIFPRLLQEACHALGVRLIHVSTDCVFSGKRGLYSENDYVDVDDDYGLSKAIGEPSGAMVLRTSVIGRELKTKNSLLEWAISRKGTNVSGYTNHFWNGVSTLEYANLCKKIILNRMWSPGVYHLHSNDVSKYDLLQIFNDAFDLKLDITPTITHELCDRRLTTVKSLNDRLEIPSISQMVSKLVRK